MKKIFRALLVFCLIVGISGCATMTVEGDGQLTPESKSGSDTLHGSFYSFAWARPTVEKCDNGRGLYRVRYHTNALYALATVFTIGLYVPMTAEWWCDGGPVAGVEEEEYKPAD